MSARDVLAEAVWLLDREIAGAPLPAPAWATFKANDPETAAIYETQAGVYLSALFAAGRVVEQGWQPIETAPRDGPVIVYQDGEQAVATWMTALEDGAGDWIIWRRVGPDALAIRMPEPTHWRPLPTPPSAEPDHG